MKVSQVSIFTPESLFENEKLARNEYYVWNVTCTDGETIPLKIRSLDTADRDIRILCRLEGKVPQDVQKDMTVHTDEPKQQAGLDGMDSRDRRDYHQQQDTLDRNTLGQGQRFTGYTATREAVDDVLEEINSEWQVIKELSVDTMAAYRDATAKPRSTDRLGKVVKHARGHTQAVDKIAKQTGDKTPNKDYARTVHEDEQLNELSNELLGKYKKAAGADASAADKKGDFKKGDKRFSGIISATKKQFNNDKKAAVEETLSDILGEDFSSILSQQHQDAEAAKVKKTVEVPYHGWIIRYRPASKPGEKITWQVMDKKGEVKHKAESMTAKDAVGDAEAWINKGGDAKQAATSNVTIDFNVDFAKEFAPEGDNFYAAIDSDNGTPVLIISTEPQSGFKKSHVRTQAHKQTAGTTRLPAITMTAKEANAIGLQANGRYMLGAKDPIDDHTAMFPLIFQSIVQGKGDMMKMGKPGLTVAHNRD